MRFLRAKRWRMPRSGGPIPHAIGTSCAMV
uniref:Uncharacterized protein n=1 Tax=Arundo donax TaxID=35708 RepID=A0A0A8Z3D2_ARUDO